MNIKSQTIQPIPSSCSFHFGAKTALFRTMPRLKDANSKFFPAESSPHSIPTENPSLFKYRILFSLVLPTVIGTAAAFLRTTQLLNRADQPWAGQTDKKEEGARLLVRIFLFISRWQLFHQKSPTLFKRGT